MSLVLLNRSSLTTKLAKWTTKSPILVSGASYLMRQIRGFT